MKRLGVLIHPEALAIWEPAIASALPMLTAEEWTNCVQFLEQALAAVSARKPDSETSDEAGGVPPREGTGRGRKAGR
jgi:hypothetical protein